MSCIQFSDHLTSLSVDNVFGNNLLVQNSLTVASTTPRADCPGSYVFFLSDSLFTAHDVAAFSVTREMGCAAMCCAEAITGMMRDVMTGKVFSDFIVTVWKGSIVVTRTVALLVSRQGNTYGMVLSVSDSGSWRIGQDMTFLFGGCSSKDGSAYRSLNFFCYIIQSSCLDLRAMLNDKDRKAIRCT